MNATGRKNGSLAGRRWRELAIVFFVLTIFLISFPFETFLVEHTRRDWETTRQEATTHALIEAERQFSSFQRSLRRLAVEIALHADVVAALGQHQTSLPRLFTLAEKFSQEGTVGVEIYDRDLALLAWSGPSGPEQRRALRIALDGQMTSYVVRTAVSSQLFLVTPVRSSGQILGAVLVRQTVDVHYPFSNRIVASEGLTGRTEQIIGMPVEFDFSSTQVLVKDSMLASTLLYGIDSSVVGSVSVPVPAQQVTTEKISTGLRLLRSILFFALAAVLCIVLGKWIIEMCSGVLRLVLLTVMLWGVRYSLLWMDFPSGTFTSGVFDPAVFASTFGHGLAKNLGEMTLTVTVLVLNLFAVRQWWRDGRAQREVWWTGQHAVTRIVTAVIMTVLLFWMLRGYGAVVRSVVFDSRLPFYEAQFVVPTAELAVMHLNLIALAVSLILVGVGCTRFLSLMANGGKAWFIVTCVLYVSTALVFGPIQSEPLMSVAFRLIVAAGFLVAHVLVEALEARQRRVSVLGAVLALFFSSGVLLYPLLASYAGERDRTQIERFALEVLRPVDNWLRNVVEDGIRLLKASGTAEELIAGGSGDARNLALNIWARSVACQEGYTCIFELLDTKGETLSRFAIGSQTSAASTVLSDLPRTSQTLFRVRTIGSGAEAVSVYAGTTPIVTQAGLKIGFGRVSIAAGHQSLFRGENPAFFRGTSQESLEGFYRPVSISEFRGGVLSTSTNPHIPFGYPVPDAVAKSLKDPSVGGVWIEEVLQEQSYESLYVRRTQAAEDLVVLSLEKRGIVWMLIGAEKLLVVYLGVLLLLGAAFFVWRRVQGSPYIWTFRDRLLGALLLSAVVPLALLLGYGQYSANERVLVSTSQRLEQQTEDLADQLRDFVERGEINVDGAVHPELAEEIAGVAGTDFNLFLGNSLTLTSRPELYAAGLLDTRLGGSAFSAIFLQGRRFYLATERIGVLRYAVGYRPLLDRNGAVAGVISVPTLYRQDEVERETATRSAFLFGLYAVVVLGIVLLTLVLAHRIARPVLQLTDVTRKVARGEMDISADLPEAEGELGELIRSFDTMTKEIQRNREDLVRAERELAWKEMAKQVAHEIKNPLTPMKLSVQHLRHTYKDKAANFSEILDQVTRTLIEQIDTLSRIASEFSHFGRMPDRAMAMCSVPEILREAIRLHAQERGVSFPCNVDGDIRPVYADREELRRAFINVLRNSIQAMNGRGTITIDVKNSGPYVMVSLRDTGPGIPPDVQQKLFQPNFSTKTDGMGLGLAIVKKTVDDLGGHIAIDSQEGKGTMVTFLLPAATSEKAQ